jgi:hypothetical protein
MNQRTKLDDALEKLRADLDWRGPGGKTQGTICLPRELALTVLEMLEGLKAVRDKIPIKRGDG